jgi:hypothetical protein
MKGIVFPWLVVLGIAMLLATGCVRVKAYQRGVHAKPAMQDQQPVDAKIDQHVEEYREGSVGGAGSGGGGCGCN